MADVNQMINFIQNSAIDYKNNAMAYASSANSSASSVGYLSSDNVRTIKDGYKTLAVEFTGFDKIIESSNKFFEIQDLRNDFIQSFNLRQQSRENNVQAVTTLLSNLVFSEMNAISTSLMNDFYNDTSYGLNKVTSDILWSNTRDKIIAESESAIDVVTNTYANRGFTLPNGIMQKSISDIINTRVRSIAESAREINISNIESIRDWKKFAVQNIVAIKSAQTSSIAQFVDLNLNGERVSADYATQYINSYKSFYDSMNSLTNAITTMNRLKLDKASTLDQNENNLWGMASQSWNFANGLRTGTRTSLAQTMGSQASAALSGINAMVSAVST